MASHWYRGSAVTTTPLDVFCGTHRPRWRRRYPGVSRLGLHLVLLAVVLGATSIDGEAQVLKKGREFQVNSAFVGVQFRPQIASFAHGRFAIIWAGIFEQHTEHGFGTWGRSFRWRGRAVAEQSLITDSEEFDDWGEAMAAIDCVPPASCTAAWIGELRDNGDVNIVSTKHFDGESLTTAPTLQVSIRPEVSVQWVDVSRSRAGNAMVVWHDVGPILDLDPGIATGRIVDSNGAAVTSPFPLASVTSDSRQAQVVALNGGGFMTAWWGRDATGNYDIYARRFNEIGQPLGAEFRVNEVTTGGQQRPAIAPADDGGFLAVWESGGHTDEQFLGVYARRFAADDTPVGPERHVNTFTLDSQVVPSVVNDGVGGFVVAWVSYSGQDGPGQDGDGPGVFGRRLHDDGSPDGLEFQINTTTSFAQGWLVWPIGLAAHKGRVVATWQDERQDTWDWGIFAQRFTVTPGTGPLCGDAHAQDLRLDLRDALQLLRASAGLRPCVACLCDADGSDGVSVADALVVLRTVVGIAVTPQCGVCGEGDESPAGAYGFGFPE